MFAKILFLWYIKNMGILSRLKHIFSNDIVFNASDATSIVTPFSTRGGKIKLDCKVTIPEGFGFALGHNGRVLDCFSSGEYFLSVSTLPVCCKKLKIHKIDKNGKIKKSFKAETYFVKTSPFDFDFSSLEKAELGQISSGIFKVGLKCTLNLVVTNISLFMSSLLEEYSYLKTGEAEKLLRMFTTEYVVKILNKYNFALFEFINLNEAIENTLKGELGQKFEKIGLKLLDIKNIKYELPKKSQKEYEANLEKKNRETQLQNDEQNEQDEQLKSNDNNDDTYVPFGNIKIESTDKIESKTEDEQFVDLNLEHLYCDDKN